MILKELIMNVEFDDLLPYLKEFEFKHLDCIYCYREAYDRLRYMQPDPDFKGVAYVKWFGEDPKSKSIVVQYLETIVGRRSWQKKLWLLKMYILVWKKSACGVFGRLRSLVFLLKK